MKNEKNLTPFNTLTPERCFEIRSMGGKAAGEARRRRKTMREAAEVYGAANFKITLPDGTEVEGTLKDAVVMEQYKKAVVGKDTTAAAFLMKLLGEDVVKVEMQSDEQREAAFAKVLKECYGIDEEVQAKDEEQD